MGLPAPLHVGSSWTRDWTCAPCIVRWILNQTTREVQYTFLYVLHIRKDVDMKTPPQSWKGWGELRASQACAPDQMSFPLPPTSISSPAPPPSPPPPPHPAFAVAALLVSLPPHLPADTTGNPQSPTPALSFYLCPTLLTFSSGYPDGVSLPTSITLSLVFFFFFFFYLLLTDPPLSSQNPNLTPHEGEASELWPRESWTEI